MTDGAAEWPEWLRRALAARGWKPAELARRSGVKDNGRPVIAPDVISGWLNTGAKPAAKFWPLLAGIFDVPVEDIALLVSGASLTAVPPPQSPEPADEDAQVAAIRRLGGFDDYQKEHMIAALRVARQLRPTPNPERRKGAG